MVSTTIHIRKAEKLPSGEHKLQVSLVESYFPELERPTGSALIFDSVILPAELKNVARLDDAAFVNESAGVWIATHGGEWDKELVREYFECILER
jgi:hypothetical protein